jgi:ABC-2 type transport system permease protein
VKELTAPFELNTIKLSKTGEEEKAGFAEVFFTSYIFLMMLFFLVLTSGQLLVRSVIEEKTNRLVEVLMSSCSPRDLMVGKILGLSGLGFTQLALWGIIGFAIAFKSGATMIAGPSALLLGVYFILGWLFYAAIFVAAGSPISTEQEAQQLTSYLSLLLVMPIIVAIPVMQDPDAFYVKILTMIPILTPTMMAIRIPIQMPSLVEILLSLLVLSASAVGMMWVAGKVFRTAMLAYGKRPSIKELIHIVRTS